jgi:hypothetical protein
MTALGILLIVIGVALVCAGLTFWPRPSRTGPADLDGPHEFRAIIDALDEQDRRSPDTELAEPPKRPSIEAGSIHPKHHHHRDHQESEPNERQGG